MLIPLKKKYLRALKGTNKGGEKPAPRKKREKIGHAEHVKRQGEQKPRTLLVDGRTGKGRMADA